LTGSVMEREAKLLSKAIEERQQLKTCPLRVIAYAMSPHISWKCEREKCAWFDDETQSCIIHVIAKNLLSYGYEEVALIREAIESIDHSLRFLRRVGKEDEKNGGENSGKSER